MRQKQKDASAANRTRGPSMATMDFTTKPLTRVVLTWVRDSEGAGEVEWEFGSVLGIINGVLGVGRCGVCRKGEGEGDTGSVVWVSMQVRWSI